MRDAYNRQLNPTGSRHSRTTPVCRIYIAKADGTGQKRLTTEFGYDGGPFFTTTARASCGSTSTARACWPTSER